MSEFDLFMSLVGRDSESAMPAPGDLSAEIARLQGIVHDALTGSSDVRSAMQHVEFLVDGLASLAARA
jgi:hypothetical protein